MAYLCRSNATMKRDTEGHREREFDLFEFSLISEDSLNDKRKSCCSPSYRQISALQYQIKYLTHTHTDIEIYTHTRTHTHAHMHVLSDSVVLLVTNRSLRVIEIYTHICTYTHTYT